MDIGTERLNKKSLSRCVSREFIEKNELLLKQHFTRVCKSMIYGFKASNKREDTNKKKQKNCIVNYC